MISMGALLLKVAAARNAPGRRVAAASSSCPASDASVTLIKAPATPRGQGSHGGPSAGPASTVRPVSARSVRSATATTGTPTVTPKATAGKKAADVASPGGLHQAARSVSATVNRRASASASAAAVRLLRAAGRGADAATPDAIFLFELVITP